MIFLLKTCSSSVFQRPVKFVPHRNLKLTTRKMENDRSLRLRTLQLSKNQQRRHTIPPQAYTPKQRKKKITRNINRAPHLFPRPLSACALQLKAIIARRAHRKLCRRDHPRVVGGSPATTRAKGE